MPLMPESDTGATPVEGKTGKLKYFDVPWLQEQQADDDAQELSTRGDHVARKLSIAGIIIFSYESPEACQPPVKLRAVIA
jgi:hypothetical protein